MPTGRSYLMQLGRALIMTTQLPIQIASSVSCVYLLIALIFSSPDAPLSEMYVATECLGQVGAVANWLPFKTNFIQAIRLLRM